MSNMERSNIGEDAGTGGQTDASIQKNILKNQEVTEDTGTHNPDLLRQYKVQLQLMELLEKQKRQPPGIRQTLRNALCTFNLFPSTGTSEYLKKANIAKSPEEAIARTWNNVFSALHISFLRHAIEVEEQLER